MNGLLNGLSIPAIGLIAGVPIPADLVPKISYDITASVVLKESPPELAMRLGKDLLPTGIAIANAVAPPSGYIGLALLFMIALHKEPTPTEQQRMWDQAQGVH